MPFQTIARTHFRCRVCGARQKKRFQPWDDVSDQSCRNCHRHGSLRPDKWMNERGWRVYTCRCPGYKHPHRIRSQLCHYRPIDVIPDPADFTEMHCVGDAPPF